MDTLIDNRTFPIEMQQQSKPKQKKSTPWMLIVLVLIALGILIFLAYRIFNKTSIVKQTTLEKQTSSLKEQRSVVGNFETLNPRLTATDRREKVQVFFGNNNS